MEVGGDQNPNLEAPSWSMRGRSKGDVRRRSNARGAMEKSKNIEVIKGKEVRRDDLIKYFLPTGFRSTFWVPEDMMAIDTLQSEEISGRRKSGGKKKSVLLFVEEEQIGGSQKL